MKVKEEEIERLKKGRTLPETESKVQILQLCLKDHLYLFLMKEFKDAFFLWLIIIISRQKMFFYYKYILKGFKFEFLKCYLRKGLCIFTRHPLPKNSLIDKDFTMLCTGPLIAWFHPNPLF